MVSFAREACAIRVVNYPSYDDWILVQYYTIAKVHSCAIRDRPFVQNYDWCG